MATFSTRPTRANKVRAKRRAALDRLLGLAAATVVIKRKVAQSQDDPDFARLHPQLQEAEAVKNILRSFGINPLKIGDIAALPAASPPGVAPPFLAPYLRRREEDARQLRAAFGRADAPPMPRDATPARLARLHEALRRATGAPAAQLCLKRAFDLEASKCGFADLPNNEQEMWALHRALFDNKVDPRSIS